MGDFVTGAECTDPTSDAGAESERAPTRDEMTALLWSAVAEVRPRASSLKVLANLVRVLQRCPWVDGDLRMELEADADQTIVHLYTEHGGVRERVLPSAGLPLPFGEIDWSMAETPDFFAPLRLLRRDGKLLFTTTGAAPTGLPPHVEIAAESTPHETPTVKRPVYVMPEAFRSGKQRRQT